MRTGRDSGLHHRNPAGQRCFSHNRGRGFSGPWWPVTAPRRCRASVNALADQRNQRPIPLPLTGTGAQSIRSLMTVEQLTGSRSSTRKLSRLGCFDPVDYCFVPAGDPLVRHCPQRAHPPYLRGQKQAMAVEGIMFLLCDLGKGIVATAGRDWWTRTLGQGDRCGLYGASGG